MISYRRYTEQQNLERKKQTRNRDRLVVWCQNNHIACLVRS